MWKVVLALSVTLSASAQQQSAPVNNVSYSEQIEQQSALLGPFDVSLVELYQQQGLVFFRQGDFLQAATALQLALQISRVNFGPKAPQQEPALRALIDVADASGEQEPAQMLHQRLVDINNHQLNSALGIADVDALMRSSQWHLQRYTRLPTSSRLDNLQMSLRLAKHSENIISRHHNDDHLALIAPLEQIALSSHHLTEYNLTLLRFFSEQGSFHQQLTEQVFQQGLEARRRVVRILRHNQASAETLAQAQIDLGDYLQRLQLPKASRKAYQQAWSTLHKAQRTEQLREWLGQPMPLLSDNQSHISDSSSLARIKAHVDTEGKVEHIEVLKTYPADNNQVSTAALQAARRLPYRVAVVDGEVVAGSVEFNLPLALSLTATP
ncbi:hypothetical protein QSV34_05155 [Porticoccus sp. W117]|uniref:hypothetical protein n=1 Tax=Porticoccus sp. W117 TaxID=3054777 RepID=UPI002595BC5E|nr:hypothetical protein [Porticoccus sp. W117]MDM3870736.1 hypothetical protein [Porticoccus sp. W117]